MRTKYPEIVIDNPDEVDLALELIEQAASEGDGRFGCPIIMMIDPEDQWDEDFHTWRGTCRKTVTHYWVHCNIVDDGEYLCAALNENEGYFSELIGDFIPVNKDRQVVINALKRFFNTNPKLLSVDALTGTIVNRPVQARRIYKES